MFKKLLALAAIASVFPAHAAVVEVGDLNIIDDLGNASDGLRYLDMTYSNNLTLSDALDNAHLTYSNARIATPGEWNDLFAAAGISYNLSSTASDAFAAGPDEVLSSGTNYDGGALATALGYTVSTWALIWSDPDGDIATTSTRDYLALQDPSARILQLDSGPPNIAVGWMLVSDPAPVPLPAAGWLFISALLGLAGKKRLSRR